MSTNNALTTTGFNPTADTAGQHYGKYKQWINNTPPSAPKPSYKSFHRMYEQWGTNGRWLLRHLGPFPNQGFNAGINLMRQLPYGGHQAINMTTLCQRGVTVHVDTNACIQYWDNRLLKMPGGTIYIRNGVNGRQEAINLSAIQDAVQSHNHGGKELGNMLGDEFTRIPELLTLRCELKQDRGWDNMLIALKSALEYRAPFRFLALPPELRNEIYKLLFILPGIILSQRDVSAREHQMLFALSQTNHQVSAECTSFMYLNRFSLLRLGRCTLRTSLARKNLTENLAHIYLSLAGSKCQEQVALQFASECRRLETVEIRIHSSWFVARWSANKNTIHHDPRLQKFQELSNLDCLLRIRSARALFDGPSFNHLQQRFPGHPLITFDSQEYTEFYVYLYGTILQRHANAPPQNPAQDFRAWRVFPPRPRLH